MIVTHMITKKVKGDGEPYPFLLWLDIRSQDPRSIKGKILFELAGVKYKETFRVASGCHIGFPCKEKPEPGTRLKVTLRYEGVKEEATVVMSIKYEDLSKV